MIFNLPPGPQANEETVWRRHAFTQIYEEICGTHPTSFKNKILRISVNLTAYKQGRRQDFSTKREKREGKEDRDKKSLF